MSKAVMVQSASCGTCLLLAHHSWPAGAAAGSRLAGSWREGCFPGAVAERCSPPEPARARKSPQSQEDGGAQVHRFSMTPPSRMAEGRGRE